MWQVSILHLKYRVRESSEEEMEASQTFNLIRSILKSSTTRTFEDGSLFSLLPFSYIVKLPYQLCIFPHFLIFPEKPSIAEVQHLLTIVTFHVIQTQRNSLNRECSFWHVPGERRNQSFEHNFLKPKEFVSATKMPLWHDDLGRVTYIALCWWVGKKWAKSSQLLCVCNTVLFTCSSSSK